MRLTCCMVARLGALPQPALPKLMERSADEAAEACPLPPPCWRWRCTCCACCVCCRTHCACCACCSCAAAAAAAVIVNMRCCAMGDDWEGVVSCGNAHSTAAAAAVDGRAQPRQRRRRKGRASRPLRHTQQAEGAAAWHTSMQRQPQIQCAHPVEQPVVVRRLGDRQAAEPARLLCSARVGAARRRTVRHGHRVMQARPAGLLCMPG